jgi:hypothetical protein
MARKTKPISDLELKNSKPKEKQHKLYDGDRLSIIIFHNGKKK